MWNIIPLIVLLKALRVSSYSSANILYRNPRWGIKVLSAMKVNKNNALFSQQSNDSITDVKGNKAAVKILGVTGGIGSGKSLACQILSSPEFQTIHKCEVHHIDSDSLAHTVYAPGSEAIRQIRAEFGDEIVSEDTREFGDDGVEEEDGKTLYTIDRKKLGSIVFSDAKAMSRLEQIVWPHVKTKILEKVEEISSQASTNPGTPKIAILEAAVLLDANWSSFLSALWIVKASPSVASDRLITNRNISEDDAMTRIKAQETRRGIGNLEEEIKKKEVNAVIGNDGNVNDLKEKLEQIWFDCESWRDGITPLGESE